MTSAEDYGHTGDEIALVPSSLIAYRHFGLDMTMRKITPASQLRQVYSPFTGAGVYEAVCTNYRSQPEFREKYGHGDVSPERECHCGFYAHYEPDGDFYPDWSWNLAEDPAFNYNNLFAHAGRTDLVLVRGVVELSGRVVMGSLGVRAQRLRIRAIAIDWAKLDERQNRQGTYGAFSVGDYHFSPGCTCGKCMKLDRPPTGGSWSEVPDELRRQYEERCREVAGRYKADFFEGVDDMVRAYPKPDLSALGITPAKPGPRESKDFGVLTPMKMTLSAADVEALRKTLFPGLDRPKKKAVAPDNPMQRAIEAKKNRPAPPGTGIDRRKRKL